MWLLKRVSKLKNNLTWLLLVSLLTITQIATAKSQLTASVDRNEVTWGEAIRYTLILTDQTQNFPEPDFNPLTADFDIITAQQSNQLNNINGKITQVQRWILDLNPKRQGDMIIPSITVEGLQSAEIAIKVLSPSATTADGKPRSIFIETSVSNNVPFVQSQFIYTVKIFYAVNLIRGTLTDPSADNALFYNLGADTKYISERNGQTYQVLERNYAVYPQKSGELLITAPTLSGAIEDTATEATPMHQFFNTGGKPLRLTAEKTAVNVQAIPPSFSGTWLPAKNLTIEQSWSQAFANLRVGEPITRTLTLTADGLTAEQLPAFTLSNVDKLNTYPDKPAINNQTLPDTIIGSRREKIAYIPTQAGEVTLPALSINWWNTATQQIETATLPAQTLQILPAVSSTETPTDNNSTVQQTATTVSPTPAPTWRTKITTDYWQALALLFFILWLITLLLWLFKKRRMPKQKKVTPAINISRNKDTEKLLYQAAEQACLQQDWPLLQTKVLAWGNKILSPIIVRNLNELASHIQSPELAQALLNLDALLYQSPNTVWEAEQFLRLFRAYKHRTTGKAKKPTEGLPPLY